MPTGDDVSSFPADLDATAKTLWKRIRETLVEESRWRRGDSLTLELYVRSLQRAREAQNVIATEGRTTTGSAGQIIQHPELKTAREAERDANDYAKELGFTPASRAKGGEPTGKPPSDPLGDRL